MDTAGLLERARAAIARARALSTAFETRQAALQNEEEPAPGPADTNPETEDATLSNSDDIAQPSKEPGWRFWSGAADPDSTTTFSSECGEEGACQRILSEYDRDAVRAVDPPCSSVAAISAQTAVTDAEPSTSSTTEAASTIIARRLEVRVHVC